MTNRSQAVMAGRKAPKDIDDDYPTPPWATRALIGHILERIDLPEEDRQTCIEPAANRGYMVEVLETYFKKVIPSDKFDYGKGYRKCCFLDPRNEFDSADWVITNPPFVIAEDFVRVALPLARVGVAMLLRTQFMEGKKRYHGLFSKTPPSIIAPFAERLTMVYGGLEPDESSAVSYSWFVWVKPFVPNLPIVTKVTWIPPCRDQLEKPTDYEGRRNEQYHSGESAIKPSGKDLFSGIEPERVVGQGTQ